MFASLSGVGVIISLDGARAGARGVVGSATGSGPGAAARPGIARAPGGSAVSNAMPWWKPSFQSRTLLNSSAVAAGAVGSVTAPKTLVPVGLSAS